MVPDLPRLRTAIASALAVLAVAVSPAAAQTWVTSDLDPLIAAPIQFAVTFLVNLLLGGIVLGVAPDYTAEMAEEIRRSPGGSFLIGLVANVAFAIAFVILLVTIIGIVVALPAALILAVVGIAGTAAAVVAIGTALTGDRPGGFTLLVGSLALALVGLVPILGQLVQWLVSTAGLGAVLGNYWSNR